jgi:hypothetical protein
MRRHNDPPYGSNKREREGGAGAEGGGGRERERGREVGRGGGEREREFITDELCRQWKYASKCARRVFMKCIQLCLPLVCVCVCV